MYLGVEHNEKPMIYIKSFPYKPNDSECEKASNSYLVSLFALVIGLPFPIVNLIATVIFYLGTKKSPYFARWHSTQALISQLSFFVINSVGVWWTVFYLFQIDSEFSTPYIIYISILILLNLTEFITTIYTAIQTRKGIHVEWFIYGKLTHLYCKETTTYKG